MRPSAQVVRTMRDDVAGRKLARGTVRRVLEFAAPHKRLLYTFIVLVVFSGTIGAANPLIYKEIINRGIIDKRTGLVLVLALVVAGLAILDALTALGQRYVSARVGESLVCDLRTRIFSHVQRMPLAFFTRTQTGALVSRLNVDVRGAQQAFTEVLSTVVGNLISVSLVLVAMFVLSWKITLISLALLPVFLFPARRVGRRLQKIVREKYNLTAEMNTMMVERFNVAGALLVKLFGRPADEDKAFSQKAGRVREIGVMESVSTYVLLIALSLTAALATALVYGWGGSLTIEGALDVGTLVALAAYLGRLYGPLTALSNMHVDVMMALVSFERVFEVLDIKPMVTEKPSAVSIPRGPASIEFRHVGFTYPNAKDVSLASLEAVAVPNHTGDNKEVLSDISFRAEPGQLVALVGPSGAGKTTISQLVPRLYDVGRGAVEISGVDVRDAAFDSLRATVGVVTQDAHMFHDTIRSNLLYAKPDATEADLREALAAAQILSFVEGLPEGLDTIVGDRGYRLSGGEKQRIAVARLLLKAPDVVVLDEATAHLDSESEVALQAALKTALEGRTSLVIAHRLSTVRDADQILVIEGGCVVERGTHEELIEAGGPYAELYQTQFRPAPASYQENGRTRRRGEGEAAQTHAAGSRAHDGGREDAGGEGRRGPRPV